MRLLSQTEVKSEKMVVAEQKNKHLQALADETAMLTKKLNQARDEYSRETKKMEEGMEAMLSRYNEKLAKIQQDILEKKKELSLISPLN